MPGESLNGFVRRLAERNGITPRELMSFEKRADVFPVSTTDDVIEGLRILSDREFDVLSRMAARPSGIGRLDQYESLAHEVCGQPISSLHGRQRLRAVCPACFAQGEPYHRLAWEYLFVGACHVHRCELLVQCPGCSEVLNWNRTHLAVCQCGLQWKDVAPTSWDDARLAGTDFLAARLHGIHSRPEPKVVAGLPLMHAVAVLLALGGLNSGLAPWQFGTNVRETETPRYLNDGLRLAAAPPEAWNPLMNTLEPALVGQQTIRPRMLEWCDWIEPHGTAATTVLLDLVRRTVLSRAGEAQTSFDV